MSNIDLNEELDNQKNYSSEVFTENEVQANIACARMMIIFAFFQVLSWLLNIFGVFLINKSFMNIYLIVTLILLVVPAIICFTYKGQGKWLKVVLLISLCLAFAITSVLFTYYVPLIIAIPIVISIRYYSKTITVATVLFTLLLYEITQYLTVFVHVGNIDMNFVHLVNNVKIISDNSKTISNLISYDLIDYKKTWDEMLRYQSVPMFLQYCILAIVSTMIASKGRSMVIEQDLESRSKERLSTEIELASKIQLSMLNTVFPPFPDRNDFEIYAHTRPAKEVGGDFYDFFLVNEDTLGIVIGDVSGKGIPAAMFMSIAKTLIKDHSLLGLQPSDIFTRVSKTLCEGNDVGLFITAWIGFLNLKTGLLTYTNAGHNPPIIFHNGKTQYLRTKPGIVLAGIDDYQYRQDEMQLNKNDVILLYTDGVTEAHNVNNELYGEKRLIEIADSSFGASTTELIRNIINDVYKFTGEAEQFDDITMLGLNFRDRKDTDAYEMNFEARVDKLHDVLAFIDEHLEKHGCSMKAQMALDVAVEELFVNIASYAYKGIDGYVTISIRFYDDVVEICMADNGIPFNPLEKEDPDVTLSAEERKIGGLGIYMAKKAMDAIGYERIGGKTNYIMLRKVIR